MRALRGPVAALAACVALGAVLGSAPRGDRSASAASSRAEPAQDRDAAGSSATANASHLWIEMRNVDLHIDDRAVLGIRHLRGEAVSVAPNQPAVLDDPKSFSVRVTSGTVGVGGDGLAALLNEVAFAYPGAPLKHLRIRIAAPYIIQSGTLHKGIDLPFEITASLTLESDGRLRLHPVKTRLLGINGEKLLRALGLHLDKLIDLRKARGVSVKGDDFFLEPTAIIPPPILVGRLASVRIEGVQVVQDFVRLPDDSVFDGYARPDSAARNFVNFRGAQLRFGKLLMTDTNLQIIDADERDPFDLYLKEYHRQLVAGTAHILLNLGLRVIMPDYRAVPARTVGR
ncbi:MAG: hypothetical protein NVS4B3_22520 [Gemmatimonadaceae bacterium]